MEAEAGSSFNAMEACMIDSVQESLRLYMYANAIFLCESLYAAFPSESNLHLLATCYFRANQEYRVYYILKGATSAENRYLLALACFKLDELAEAEAILSPPNSQYLTDVPGGPAGYYILGVICRMTERQQMAINHLKQALAVDPFFWSAYEELCKLGAEGAARAHYESRPVTMKVPLSVHAQEMQPVVDQLESFVARTMPSASASPRPTRNTAAAGVIGQPLASVASGQSTPVNMPSPLLMMGTPSYTTPSPISSQMPSGGPPAPQAARGGAASGGGGDGSPGSAYGADAASPRTASGIAPASAAPSHRRKVLDEGKLRKVSGRLFAEPPALATVRRSARLAEGPSPHSASGAVGGAPTTSANNSASTIGGRNTSRPGSGRRISTGTDADAPTSRRGSESGQAEATGGAAAAWEGGAASSSTRGSLSRRSSHGHDELQSHNHPTGTGGIGKGGHASMADEEIKGTGRKRTAEGERALFELMDVFCEAYHHLCLFRCKSAIEVFQRLPPEQYNTGWVLTQVGRAYFEMSNYREAERVFDEARRVAPHQVSGMEIYSTVLYHLKKDMELSYLAQECVALDRLAPQSWCVMGNCFSLLKDHEAALKFFQRALHLDPFFTYAHTLSGHEHVAMEEFDEGVACYRSAVRCDSRHYNAWYGLGTVYLRQEKYDFAEYHFRRALDINCGSSVLLCYLGMALHALKRNAEALRELDRAVSVDSKNPLPKFHKADVLMSEDRYQEALEELEEMKELVPRESAVWFLMGRIYKRLDQPDNAMLHFSYALDLKPSSADVNLIKSAIEKLHVPDEMEEGNL